MGAVGSTPFAIGPTPTPTPSLADQKLVQEVQQLDNSNDWWWSNSGTLITTAGIVLVALAGIFRWFADKSDERQKRSEERFDSLVSMLGSEQLTTQVGAAISLRTFLQPGYERFSQQVFSLASAHLQLRSGTATPSGSERVLVQTLTTLFRESYETARKLMSFTKPSPVLDGTGVWLNASNLSGADFTFAWLPNSNFVGADLNSIRFIRANLTGADLTQAKLKAAGMNGATLWNAKLVLADLEGADLTDAMLMNCDLTGANLANGQLIHANLGRCQLQRVNFADAVLDHADLGGADLSESHLSAARSLKQVRLHSSNGLSKDEVEACLLKGAVFQD